MAQEQPTVNISGETWKDIVGFEGLYLISNLGRIKCVGRDILYKDHMGRTHKMRVKEKIKAQQTQSNGYRFAALWKDGRSHYVTTHRAVAEAFLPNPKNLRTVNHKNGVRTDNRLENIEWASYSDNLIHSMYTLGRINSLGKPVLCIETGETYRSVRDAAQRSGGKEHNLRHHLRGHSRLFKGNHWKFINKEEYGRKQHFSAEGV